MKKIIALTTIFIMLIMALTGCGETKEQAQEEIREKAREGFFDEVAWDPDVVDIYTDNNGNKTPMPKGFTYSTGNKTTGLVIKDNIGNEFVWVPMDLIYMGTSEDQRNSLLNEYYRTGSSEEYSIGLTKSIEQYGGFYVSRNEMLTATQRSNNKITNNYDNSNTKIRNVTYVDALRLSDEMYADSNTVVSHLMYGAEWDAIMAWYASEIEGERALPMVTLTEDSTSAGLYRNSDFARTTNREIAVIIFKDIDVNITKDGQEYNFRSSLSNAEIETFKSEVREFANIIKELSDNKIENINITEKVANGTITNEMLDASKTKLDFEHPNVAEPGRYTDVIYYYPGDGNMSNLYHYDWSTSESEMKVTHNNLIGVTNELRVSDHSRFILVEFIQSLLGISKLDGHEVINSISNGENYGYTGYGEEGWNPWYKAVLLNTLSDRKGIPEEMLYTYYALNSLEDVDKGVGNRNLIKNIKGMAGGVAEWTQEKYTSNGIEYRVARGGSLQNNGNKDMHRGFPIYNRRPLRMSVNYETLGFRTCLYIKPTDVVLDAEDIRQEWRDTGKVKEQIDNTPIPNGYEYIGGTKNTGIKIRDMSNRKLIFVWVPVDDTTVGNIESAKNHLARIYGVNNLKVHGSIEGTEQQLINNNQRYLNDNFREEIDPNVKASIDLYKGFYVSQAELGYEVDENGNITNPYSNVPRGMIDSYAAEGDYYRGYTSAQNSKVKVNGRAQEQSLTYNEMKTLASQIGKENTTTSHMTYGAEWDAIMVWLLKTQYKSSPQDILADSSNVGKYQREGFRFADVYSNNIWGLAGNLAELTQELRTDGSYVLRGGAYNDYGNQYYMASRTHDVITANDLRKDSIGFRACLYINTGREVNNPTTEPENTPGGNPGGNPGGVNPGGSGTGGGNAGGGNAGGGNAGGSGTGGSSTGGGSTTRPATLQADIAQIELDLASSVAKISVMEDKLNLIALYMYEARGIMRNTVLKTFMQAQDAIEELDNVRNRMIELEGIIMEMRAEMRGFIGHEVEYSDRLINTITRNIERLNYYQTTGRSIRTDLSRAVSNLIEYIEYWEGYNRDTTTLARYKTYLRNTMTEFNDTTVLAGEAVTSMERLKTELQKLSPEQRRFSPEQQRFSTEQQRLRE